MRIAFVAQPFEGGAPATDGGSLAIWTSRVATLCAERGHHPFVFENHGGLLRARAAYSAGVNYIYTPTGLNRLMNKALGAVRSVSWSASRADGPCRPRFASIWQDSFYAIQAGNRSRQLGCDVVHIMNFSQFAPLIRRLHPRSKISLHMHCEWLTQLDYRVIEGRLEHVDLLVGCSDYITRKIAKRFPRFEQRCVTVPNGAATAVEGHGVSRDQYGVLFVGRVSPEKGVHVLVRAFHEVLRRFPKARLHIVGGLGSAPYEYIVGLSDEPHVGGLRVFYEGRAEGGRDPYVSFVEREAGKELGKRVFLDGRIAHNEIGGYYERAAILVNPSLSEAFGMSLVEAMMHGIPVIASRVGGMPNIVDHGKTGLLVDPADAGALAAAICECLADSEKARSMGEAGRRKAMKRFSWESVTEHLLDHLRGLIDAGDRGN